MADYIDPESMPGEPVRPSVATGVRGTVLHDGPAKVVLTRVVPGGGFAPHTDAHGHLLCVLRGRCSLLAGEEERELEPGTTVRIAPGERHGYRNPGKEELVLLSLNLPPSPSE